MLKHIKFAELQVENQNRAIGFYTEQLGLRLVQDAPYENGWRWVELEIPGAQTRILLTKQGDNPRRDTPSLIFVVDDIHASYEELLNRGVAFSVPPGPAPWDEKSHYALFEDPEGNVLMLGSA